MKKNLVLGSFVALLGLGVVGCGPVDPSGPATSGIIKERQADIETAAKEVGMQVDHVDEKGGWVVMQMSKVK